MLLAARTKSKRKTVWSKITTAEEPTWASRGHGLNSGSQDPHEFTPEKYIRNVGLSIQEWLITFGQPYDRIEILEVLNATVRTAAFGQELPVGTYDRKGQTIHISGGTGVVRVRYRAWRSI